MSGRSRPSRRCGTWHGRRRSRHCTACVRRSRSGHRAGWWSPACWAGSKSRSSLDLQSYLGAVTWCGTNCGVAAVSRHAVNDASLDTHAVVGYRVHVESLPAVSDEDLDSVLIDLGIDIDLVGSRVLGCIDHCFAHGTYQG